MINLRDKYTFSSIATLDVAAYLRSRGWFEEKKWGKKASIWLHQDLDGEILLPLSKELKDFHLRMGDIIYTLSRLENRSRLEILNDISVVSAVFKEKSPQEEFELEGVVIKLMRTAKTGPGTITISGAVEDKVRRISAELDEKNYLVAVKAHANHDVIRVTGELVKSGGPWILKNPRYFKVLTEC